MWTQNPLQRAFVILPTGDGVYYLRGGFNRTASESFEVCIYLTFLKFSKALSMTKSFWVAVVSQLLGDQPDQPG